METANIKLASVASDVFGVSGRAMLRALIAGEASTEAMADLARGLLRRKRADLILGSTGGSRSITAFSWRCSCAGSKQSRRTSQHSTCASASGRALLHAARTPDAIPGVDWLVAAVLIAEIGVDMSVFLSVYHRRPGPASVRQYESASRQKSGRARKGDIHSAPCWRRTISAARTKGSYLKDKFHRLKARRDALRAALAIAHKILVSAYHMLAKSLPYRELGQTYLDHIGQTRTVANLKRRLERLGYRVTLEPTVQAT